MRRTKNAETCHDGLADARLRDIWRRLSRVLDEWDDRWRTRIGIDVGPPLRADPKQRPTVSNDEAFKAFALALLSGNTRWDRIAAIQRELRVPFCDFDPQDFAMLTERDLHAVVAWFRERRAGAARLGRALRFLQQTAAIMAGRGSHQNAESMITKAFEVARNSPEQVAVLFGVKGDWKLPGFGIALAAEGLRNLGFDLAKPDRHVTRAIGSWALADFEKWERQGAYTPPAARPAELIATMMAVRQMAIATHRPVTRISSAIWLAGAVSGARLSNDKLAEIGRA